MKNDNDDNSQNRLFPVVRNASGSGKKGGNHGGYPALFRFHVDFVPQAAQKLLVAAASKITAFLIAAVVLFAAAVNIVDGGARPGAAWTAPVSVQTRNTQSPPSSSAQQSSLRIEDGYCQHIGKGRKLF